MILPRVLLPVFSVLLLAPISAYALEPLGDDSLSHVIGQDGMTLAVKLPNAALKFSQLSLLDSNGVAGGSHVGGLDYTSPGAWLYAPKNYDANGAIQFFADENFSTASSQPITVNIDAGSGTAGATLNVALAMPADMQGLRINPFSLYLWDGPGNIFNPARPTLQTGVTEVLRSGVINMLFSSSPIMNFQLGSEPQGHLMSFSAGMLSCISNVDSFCGPISAANEDKISLLSDNVSTDSQISLDFLFDARAYGGFGLAGMYADIESTGLVLGREGTTTKFDIHLLNVDFGTVGTAIPGGPANGQAISRMGAEGVTITDLQTRIHGI